MNGQSGIAKTLERATNRRQVLGRTAVGAAALAGVALLTGPTSGQAQQGGIDPLVGLWDLDFTTPDGASKNILLVQNDGTWVAAAPAPVAPPASAPPVTFSPVYGLWQRLGPREYRWKFRSLALANGGVYAGMLEGVSRRLILTNDEQSFDNPDGFTFTLTDPTGAVLATIPGTGGARRINLATT